MSAPGGLSKNWIAVAVCSAGAAGAPIAASHSSTSRGISSSSRSARAEGARVFAAVVAGVTVPRFLVEAGLNAHVETSTERKQTIAELFALSRTLGTVANNVNQLARYANTEGRFPEEAETVVAEYRGLSARIDETIRLLAGA